MYMIMFVLDDPNLLDAMLEAWEKAGVSGVTIIESTGIHRRRRHLIPMRYIFEPAGSVEEGHYTLFAIVPDQEVVQACLQACEGLVGDLNQPRTGVFASWALDSVKGFPKQQEGEG